MLNIRMCLDQECGDCQTLGPDVCWSLQPMDLRENLSDHYCVDGDVDGNNGKEKTGGDWV